MNHRAIILCSGKVRDTVIRHQPFWMRHAMRFSLLTPYDDTLRLEGHQNFVCGTSHFSGGDNVQRLKYALRLLADAAQPYKSLKVDAENLATQFSIWDCTSICLRAELPHAADDEIAGLWYADAVTEHYTAGQYCQFPIFMGASAVIAISEAAEKLDDKVECGVPDRFLGLAVKLAGVKVKQLFPHAYVHANRNDAELVDRVAKGAYILAGLKDAHSLALAMIAKEAA